MSDKKARKDKFLTPSGIEMESVYTPEHTEDIDYKRDIGKPGEYPFTRGCYPGMYRTFPWMIRQVMGYGTPESTVDRWKKLMERGGQVGYKAGEAATSIVMDMPTNFCLDSDNPRAYHQVGGVGIAIDHYKDFVELMRDFPMDQGFANFVVHGNPPIITALYIAAAEELGYSIDKLRGSSKNDPFQSHICERIQLIPIEADVRLCLDLLEFCAKYMPAWNPISLEGYGYRSSGCDAIDELAVTLATAAAYVQGGINRGLDVDRFVPRISFFMGSSVNFLEEVAKFRAARRIWARLIKEEFGAKDPKSMLFRTFICTTPADYTAQQAFTNVIRGTIQAMAAVMGGVQAISVTPYEEAHSIPTLESHTLAIRTQQIILEESGVADTADPLGGAWSVERLTNELEQKVKEYMERIKGWGNGRFLEGMIAGTKNRQLLRGIEETAVNRQRDIDSGKRVMVGANKYTMEETEDMSPHIFKVDEELRHRKIEDLKKFKASRDSRRIKAALDKLTREAKSDHNIMPTLIETVKEGVTVEEAMNVFRQVYGIPDFWKGRLPISQEGETR